MFDPPDILCSYDSITVLFFCIQMYSVLFLKNEPIILTCRPNLQEVVLKLILNSMRNIKMHNNQNVWGD